MSQNETIQTRNSIIIWSTIISLALIAFMGWLIVKEVGIDFGESMNRRDENVTFQEEATNLRLKAVGEVYVGEAPAPSATPAAAAEEVDPVIALMTEKGYACMSCHQVDTKVVGPSYKDVAAKYAGDASAYDMLAEKIKAGGAGNWGEIAMSPNPTVTDEDMKTILDWIMAFSGGEEAAEEATTEVAPAADTTTEEAAPAESGEATTEAADAATSDVLTNEQANALMTEKGYICLTCHDVNVKKVGPTYKEVAAKYAGDATANTALAEKIKAGGVGTWGQIPMPPNPTVSDEDMQKLVTWILSVK